MSLSDDTELYPIRAETERRQRLVDANDQFLRLMTRAIKRGREHATPGVHVDRTPCVLRTIRGEPASSGMGSPGQMCTEGLRGDTGRMKHAPGERR
ncbi:MAG TPA: hypothetical protein VEU47_11015 [Candidatus Cybelea sp.]|nr:hypothetical protein [Candidatus Cybelea sp.]